MKNPFLSAWLSAANKAGGPLRSAFMAEAKKRQAALANQWMKSLTAGLSGATPKSAPKPPTRKK